jgi:hypothetical protein
MGDCANGRLVAENTFGRETVDKDPDCLSHVSEPEVKLEQGDDRDDTSADHHHVSDYPKRPQGGSVRPVIARKTITFRLFPLLPLKVIVLVRHRLQFSPLRYDLVYEPYCA